MFALRLAYRRGFTSRSRSEAEVLAYADCLLQWHRRHPAHPHLGRCAGCGEPLINQDALDLGQGVRAHFDRRLLCLTRYGHSWRRAAVAGLSGLGLGPPAGFELL